MILIWLKIILALLLIWPRGYLLIYLIDRTKSFNFGFKFFVGWLFGLAGFTLDLFAALVFGGQSLNPVVLLLSATSQIIGFSFMIWLFERKIIYPKFKNFKKFFSGQLHNFLASTILEKSVLFILLISLLIRVVMSVWQVTYLPTYDFDAWNNWNLRSKVIYTQSVIPLDRQSPFYLGGGISSYPLNDSLFKVWLAKAAGEFSDRVINLASIFYYLLLAAIFYFALPSTMSRLIKLVTTYLLSSVPLLYFHSHVAYADLFYSIFLFVSVIALFYFIAGGGKSFFYLSGIAGAFGIWTKNEGLTILLPLLIIVSIILLLRKQLKLKDWLLHWFFAALTVLPWLAFRFINRLDVLSGDSSTFNLVFNYQFIGEVVSSIFFRSHFALLFLLLFGVVIFRFKDIYQNPSLRFFAGVIMVSFVVYNGIIIFTDKAYDLSAVTRINMQLVPLVLGFLAFFYEQFFGQPRTLS